MSSDQSNACQVEVPSCLLLLLELVLEIVCFPSLRIGLLLVLYIDVVLFLMEASVGGGQLVDLLDSTNKSLSGRLVLTDRRSPSSIILLVFIEMSGCCGFVCCCVAVLLAVYCG